MSFRTIRGVSSKLVLLLTLIGLSLACAFVAGETLAARAGGATGQPAEPVASAAGRACGSIGRLGPGYMFEIRATRLSCRSARGVVRRANRVRCPNGACVRGRTILVGGYRCRFGRIPPNVFTQRALCTQGKRAVSWKIAFD